MDVITWVIGLIAGLASPRLRTAAGLAVLSSIALRTYQYFWAEPQMWGKDFPEDLFGATAMILVCILCAWIGSVIRANVVARRANPV